MQESGFFYRKEVEMSDIVSLSCPNCNGRLEITQDIDRFSCAHCGTEHIVKRGGGIISLAPVLENVSKGVDSTASELAIVRLDKEILSLNQKISEFDEHIRKRDNGKLIGVFGVVCIIGGILMWVLTDCGAVGLVAIIPGLFMLMGFATEKPSIEQHALLNEKLKELKAERNQHRDKLNQRNA